MERFARLRARFLAQEELERRPLLAQSRQQTGEQEGRNGRDDAHPQLADERGRGGGGHVGKFLRSEEHTSELQSLMRISYAVFCLKKKKTYSQNSRYAI